MRGGDDDDEKLNEDDVDSNCQEYGGNDYPDKEDYYNDDGYEYGDDDIDEFRRNRQVVEWDEEIDDLPHETFY